MPVRIALIANCDDAVVFWSIDKAITDCWGFAIEREQKMANGDVRRVVLDNRTGFVEDHPQSGDHRPSTTWPFQRFWWADHSVDTGDRVRYRVVPMVRVAGQLQESITGRSRWTRWVVLGGTAGSGMEVYFNRGLVISQFMSRYLARLGDQLGLTTQEATLKAFKASLSEHELPIRRFLSGTLRERMLRILAEAKTAGHDVYAALYELEDDELIEALCRLKAKGHVVLANGSITKKTGETSADARTRDENAAARKRLIAAGLEVHGRFVSPGALGHNKFVVVAKKDAGIAAWTGSTNWTRTGLCTQVNNGLMVTHAGFANEYLQQWKRLRDAGSAFPKPLTDANATPKRFPVRNSKAELWFTRTAKGADLAAIDAVVNAAEEGFLFLMFQPGSAGTLATVRKLFEKPGKLYVKGVVSTLPPATAPDDADHVDVVAVGDGQRHPVGVDIVQPTGIVRPFASWAATVTRQQFLSNIGFAIVHSKLIVVDPFTRPVVITGSHNFSSSASSANDENFVIVRDNRELATHYAAHVLSVYHHYRWLAYVADQQRRGIDPMAHLRQTDEWQKSHLKGLSRRELDFWVR